MNIWIWAAFHNCEKSLNIDMYPNIRNNTSVVLFVVVFLADVCNTEKGSEFVLATPAGNSSAISVYFVSLTDLQFWHFSLNFHQLDVIG
jgi:hypothetical protein